MAEGTRMLQRRATEAVWNVSAYVLAAGEIGVTTDTNILKIGDGVNAWSALDPAFDTEYLPILGTAANSALLGGVSVTSLVKVADTDVLPTNNTYVKRTADGGIKATDATEVTEVTTLQQQSAAIVDSRKMLAARTVSAAATLALTDINKSLYVNNASTTTQIVITVPLNSSVAIPVGSVFHIIAHSTGGAKITPAGGVGYNGPSNVMPGYGCIRLVKTGTDNWDAFSLNVGKRLPKIKVYRSVGGQSYGAYTAVPYNAIDTVDTYNPDNEWFSIPVSGMAAARRIVVNKDGEYLLNANFSHAGSPGQTWTRIVQMINDNTDVGGRLLSISPTLVVGSVTCLVRATAGQSFGVWNGAFGGAVDSADPLAGGLNPNNFQMTRMSD